ncbi:MAG: T9SS type A sorting domain-containing protein [Flavobacteriales bacterium]
MKHILTFICVLFLTIGNVVAEDFTLMVLPDTQFYIVSWSTPAAGGQGKPIMFQHQIDFIKNQKDNLNIKFVTHVGDIVDHGDKKWEWDLANSYMSQLDGIVPYAIAPGNHDADVMWTHNYTLLNSTFPASRYQNEPWFGGNFPAGNYKNNYELFSASGMDFIIIHLESDPQADARTWASGILDQYPNRRAIITTHWYLEGGISAQGTNIWNDVVKNHANVFMVICGHSCAREGMSVSTNNFGGKVYQILTDYQCDYNGGNGQLRYYTFHPDQNKIEGFTYSTETQKYGTHFLMDYQMQTAPEPQILGVKSTPSAVKSTDAVNISATITDDKSVASATLLWGLSSGNLSNSVAMTASGNSYSAMILPQADGATVYYEIVAVDGESNSGESSVASYKVSDNPTLCFVDYDATDLNFSGFGGSSFTKVANPSTTGINASAFVGECIKSAGSETWGGIYSETLSSKIDFSANKFFKMKVYSPKICKVLMKLEDSGNSAVSKEVELTTTQLNQWEELTFDFSAATSSTYDKITLFFDFGGTTANDFYFDDIYLVPEMTTGILENTSFFSDLRIYPNPVNDELNVQNKTSIEEVHIHNFAGQEMESIFTSSAQLTIATCELPKGIYTITIRSNGEVTYQKFVKE